MCIDLGTYVHDLNTNYALYTALVAALPPKTGKKDNISSSIFHPKNEADEETLLVGRMLQRDFERFGVHLKGSTRDRMAHLVAQTQTLGYSFAQNVVDPLKYGQLTLSGEEARAVTHLPSVLRRCFRPWQSPRSSMSGNDGKISGVAAQGASSTLLSLTTYSDSEVVRREAYKVYCTQPVDNLRVLEELVEARHEMATLMGSSSFAAYQLDEFSLAGTPAAVSTFLDTLSDGIRPAAHAEAEILAGIKRLHNISGGKRKKNGEEESFFSATTTLQPWDRDWALRLALQSGGNGGGVRHEDLLVLDNCITLDGCLTGFSAMLDTLMSVKLKEVAVGLSSRELWAPGVRKFIAEDSTDGSFLGVVYLDVFRRKNKFPGAAHFTLRCSRQLDDDNTDQKNGKKPLYQTPVVAVVANFTPDTFLTHRNVETLLHEFGHALNSLLSKTRYQHLSGTRGPQDVIEIPSHVFEHFAVDPTLLQLMVHHSKINNSFQKNKFSEKPRLSSSVLAAAVAVKKQFAAMTLQSTLSMCAVDQLLHGESPPVGAAAERQIAELMGKHIAPIGHAAGTHPHLRFNHLIGYGANYYCYLFAQCISAAVWDGDTTGEWPSGEVLRRRLLQPGGAKVASHFVDDLFKGRGSGGDDVLVHVVEGERQGWYPKPDSLLNYLEI